MSSDWPKVSLGEKIRIQTGNPFESDQYTENPGDVRLLRGANISQGKLDWGNEKRWPASGLSEVEEYLLDPGDVILAMDRPWIEAGLKFAQITSHHTPCLLVQRVARLTARDDFDQTFLKYVIQHQRFTEYVKSVQTGSAVPHISAKQIRNYEFRCPPLPVQRRITNILGALDDKIELNRRMNETLEEMAQALYRHWFVDFGPFQDQEFKDTEELGPIPKGWDTAPLDEVASFLNGTQWSRYKPESDDEETLQVIKIKELRNGFSEKSDEVSKEDILNKYIIEDGDIIFSWSGSLLLRIWSDGQGALNQHLFKVSSERFPKWFYYQGVRHHIDRFRRIAESKATTMGHIKRSHLSESHVPVPPKEVMEEAHQQISPLMQHQISNLLESKKLAETRDYLLPKLISGEIEVDVAEKGMEAKT